MADQPQEFEPESVEADEIPSRRSFLGVIVAVVVIVLIALALLLGGGRDADSPTPGSNGDKTIESVNGLDPEPGAVSVWVTEGNDVNAFLVTADVRTGDVVSMGGGRYVITVPEGSESNAIARLLKVGGVIDAGLVYATRETE